jgi:hypothetical protein
MFARKNTAMPTRSAMHPVTPLLKNCYFDDTTIQLLGEVIEAACRKLHNNGRHEIVRDLIAIQIIEAAQRGERDPDRLRDAGLTGMIQAH